MQLLYVEGNQVLFTLRKFELVASYYVLKNNVLK